MTRETTGALADAWDLASQLMDYASEKGFEPPQAFYISGGEIDVALPGGEKLYSDAGHLWCEDCADATLGKALPLMPESDRKSYSACPTDASGEDTCPHCSLCGTTLSGSISEEAVQDELYAYREDPLGLEEAIKPERRPSRSRCCSGRPLGTPRPSPSAKWPWQPSRIKPHKPRHGNDCLAPAWMIGWSPRIETERPCL